MFSRAPQGLLGSLLSLSPLSLPPCFCEWLVVITYDLPTEDMSEFLLQPARTQIPNSQVSAFNTHGSILYYLSIKY
ncbi:uncharacterized protein BO96DRAFT_406997 [Aspergillus niger CBS 101883]|uniref:uncharacterized protein n=1 Tax=Aspergillus lacticoffeatus (strain CBS 101883) TaxID=1450533 RepID=UPI000D7EDD14|nr:uncharacterized protein BO96DRAFT_406997 [Aspergillus niger CBS 101883]PYH62307.1 hypothetical protein BO96DRAFT_406997 [Aspergillus niger CBS 101883]